MRIIIGLLSGISIGIFIGYKIHNRILLKKLDKEFILKRGIYKGEFETSSKFSVEAEYTIIDESSTMVKIEVNIANIKTNEGRFNTSDSMLKSLKKMIDGWYNKNNKCLNEFKLTLKEARLKKLNELLGKNE